MIGKLFYSLGLTSMFSKKFYFIVLFLVLPLFFLLNYDIFPILNVKLRGTEKEVIITDKKISRITYSCGNGKKCEDLTHQLYVADTSLNSSISVLEVSFYGFEAHRIGDRIKINYLPEDLDAPQVLKGLMTKSELRFYLTALVGIVFIVIGFIYKKNKSLLHQVLRKYFSKFI